MGKYGLTMSYFGEIYKKSFIEVWKYFGMWGKLLDGAFIVGILAYKLIIGDIASLLIWLGEYDVWVFIFWFAIILIPIVSLINSVKVAALRDQEQTEKLSLKEYDDLEIEYYEYPWTDHQLNLGAGDFNNFLKIGLQVRNNGGIKVDCGLRMMSVQYNGYASNNDWVPNPNAVEKKLLKWDEGYDVHNGKIELYPNGGIGRILFAESNPYGMEFWFWYVDGRSPNHQVLEGTYKVRIQLEGDSEKDGIKIALKPIEFDILLTYKMRKLLDVSVVKLPMEAAEHRVHPTGGIRPTKWS